MLTELQWQRTYFKARISRLVDRFYCWLAWLLSKKLVYYSGIRLWANATQGDYSHVDVTDVNICDALKRWEKQEKEK